MEEKRCKNCKHQRLLGYKEPCAGCIEFSNFVLEKSSISEIESISADQGPHPDNVNHPRHYTQGKFECIEVIEEITKPLEKFEAYLTGTILKYLWRWKHKNGLEDLKKARWYLDKLIKKVEGE